MWHRKHWLIWSSLSVESAVQIAVTAELEHWRCFFFFFFFKSQFSTSELNLSVGNAYRLLNLDQLYHSLEQFSDCKLK